MSTKKQREMLRQRRIELDELIAENRENPAKVIFDLQPKDGDLSEEKVEPKKESTPKKKSTTTKKKTSQKGEK